jgi:hypothetical protein
MTTEQMPQVTPFNPGEPYDYSKLNSLVNALSWLNKNSSLSSSTISSKTEMQADSEKIPPAGAGAVGATKKMTITFPNAFQNGIPVITVTPKFNTSAKDGSVTYYVSDVSKTGFSINYMVSTSLKASAGIYFNWIAMYVDNTVK